MKGPLRTLVAAGLTLAFAQSHAIELGVLDDFEDETEQGWSHGGASPNPPLAIPGGGDGGAEDAYLENFSTGDSGAGGRHVMFNRDARWTGDWIAAGVNKVRVNVANFGATVVNLRIALVGPIDRPCWASTTAFDMPADSTWRNIEFLIDESTMTQVAPGGTLEDTLRDVTEIRILSSAAADCRGDRLEAIVGYDDFQTDADTDLDGVNDSRDNCTLASNPPVCIDNTGATPVPAPSFTNQTDCETAGLDWGQPDTDADLYGNACDGDIVAGPFLSGDCSVNFVDLNALKAAIFSSAGTPAYNPNADLDFNGSVNFADLGSMKGQFFGSPGPGLGNCGCAPEDQGLDNGADFFVDNDMDMVNDIDQLFVRGGMVLDWGAVEGINNVVNMGGGAYQARFNVNAAGTFGYKVADFDWVVEYGNLGTPPTEIGTPVTLDLAPGFDNSLFVVPSAGCYQFDFTVVPADPPDPTMPVPAMDVTVTGPLP